MSSQFWNTLGLVANIVGAGIMFKFGLPQPDFHEFNGLAATKKDPIQLERQKSWHMFWARTGVGLLGAGFVFQLIGTWM